MPAWAKREGLATETTKYLSLKGQIDARSGEYISLRDELDLASHATDPLYYSPGPGGDEPEYRGGFVDDDQCA